MEVTILMPCLNEAETLGTCIKKALHWINKNNIDGEVLIADNGSSDGSQMIATNSGARCIHVPGKGYGAALINGIRNAKGDFIIMGDCDDSYDFSNLDLFLEKLREGFDLVMGNRFQGGIGKDAMPFLHKYVGNPVLSFMGRKFFKSDIGDFHCGLRGFKQSIYKDLKLQTTGMEFASEMIVKSTLFKLKITEVPTTLSKDGRSRAPHLRTWRDGWRHLTFLLIYSPNWLFKIPGVFFMCLGIILMLLTMFRPFEIAKDVYFDTNTLIFAAVFINLGFTILSLGLFTKTFATAEGLLPRNRRDKIFDQSFTLEIGLLIGIVLLLTGIGISIYAFYLWEKVNFGRLEYDRTLRLVVPAGTFILLGVQTIFSSFFISILKIKRSNNEVA
jgi:glycosyltransferase involved in cell wall biosynthesis